MSNSIEEIKTWAILKDIKVLDLSELLRKKEKILDLLRRLKEHHHQDKNMLKVVNDCTIDLNDADAFIEECLEDVNLNSSRNFNNYKITMLIQEVDSE